MRAILFALTALFVAACSPPPPPAASHAPSPAVSRARQTDGPRVALVIGNARYAHAGRLENPPNDARLVAQALAGAGFATVDARADLGVASFRRALKDFRERASGAQVALVYYAGHGIEAGGRNWLIPTDAVLSSEYDLTDEAISLDQVMEALKGADLRVAILDACRDNPLGRSWSRGTRGMTRGLAPVDADDVLVIYAAAPGQTAADGEGQGNSPFAVALARRLPEPGLPIQLLGGAVRDDVLGASGGKQRPFVSASITGTPFALVPGDSELERLREENKALRESGVTAAPAPAPSPAAQPPKGDGQSFRDCATCPEMVRIPSGTFLMGSSEREKNRADNEGPQHYVTIRGFAVGKFEVTFDEWDACGRAGACSAHAPDDQGWGRGRRPVINVSWQDAQGYLSWLSKTAGKPYRLLSEAEWEYAARAGTSGAFIWGDDPKQACTYANVTDATANRELGLWLTAAPCNDGYGKRTAPAGAFQPNAFGLNDMAGNVHEWVQDRYIKSYAGLPVNGAANEAGRGSDRVIRGGSWGNVPATVRAAYRMGIPPTIRLNALGFRVARDL